VTINVRNVNQCPTAVALITPNLILDVGQTRVVAISDQCGGSCLRFDGTASTDPDNDPLSYHWLIDGAPAPVASGAVVVNCLEAGNHHVTLAVDDGRCTVLADVVVDVITPGEAVEELATKTSQANIERKNKRPLIASLRAATASFDRESWQSGQNQLRAYINKMRVLVAHGQAATGQELIDLAQQIIDQVQASPSCDTAP
jgi:hypothetical protein